MHQVLRWKDEQHYARDCEQIPDVGVQYALGNQVKRTNYKSNGKGPKSEMPGVVPNRERSPGAPIAQACHAEKEWSSTQARGSGYSSAPGLPAMHGRMEANETKGANESKQQGQQPQSKQRAQQSVSLPAVRAAKIPGTIGAVKKLLASVNSSYSPITADVQQTSSGSSPGT